MDRAKPLYRSNFRCLLTLLALRCRNAERRPRAELVVWRGRTCAEGLVEGRGMLVVRPGGTA
jgi:hypothetical protein